MDYIKSLFTNQNPAQASTSTSASTPDVTKEECKEKKNILDKAKKDYDECQNPVKMGGKKSKKSKKSKRTKKSKKSKTQRRH